MSLQIWLPLDGNLNNQGVTGFKPVGSSVTYATGGKISSKCWSGGTVTIGAADAEKIFNNNQLSVAFWIYPRANGNGRIFGNESGSGKQRYFTIFQYANGQGGELDATSLHLSWAGASSHFSSVESGVMPKNKWTHVCVTYNRNNNINIYINGEKIKTYTSPYLEAASFKIDTDILVNSSIRYMNDLRIYNHTLEPREVKELAKGLLVHYTFDSPTMRTNLFNTPLYLAANQKNNCTLVNYGTNGFTMTSTGSDPWVGNVSSLNGSLGAGVAFPVTAGYEYTLSWEHVSGLELNKNFITFYNSSNVAIANYTSLGAPNAKGNMRYETFTVPSGAVKVYARLGQQSLTSGESITIDKLCLRAGGLAEFGPVNTTELVYDSSGYNHHASMYNKCILTTDTQQGHYALRTYGNTASSSLAASSYIKSDIGYSLTPTAFTISFAAKVNAWGVQTSGLMSLSTNASTPTDYTACLLAQYDSKFQLNATGGDTNVSLSTNLIKVGEWHHYALRWDGSSWTGFRDGNDIQSLAASITPDPFRYIYLGLNAAGGAYRDADVSWGEFRLYTTALSDTEIIREAQLAQRLLRNGTEQLICVNEGNITTSQINAAGMHTLNQVSELLELDDGSCWIQISHHNNRGMTYRFASTDDFANKFVYHNDDCWSAFHLISQHGLYNGQYEFMAMENVGTTNNFNVYRWSQTVNPLTATYSDVAPGSAKVTYNDKYTVPTRNGGMWKINSNTFFCITNTNSGNWFGAFGAWAWHGSGIPTFQDGSTSGLLELYMRIDPKGKLYREFKGGITMPTTINEI